jgi:hypothetical protein
MLFARRILRVFNSGDHLLGIQALPVTIVRAWTRLVFFFQLAYEAEAAG